MFVSVSLFVCFCVSKVTGKWSQLSLWNFQSRLAQAYLSDSLWPTSEIVARQVYLSDSLQPTSEIIARRCHRSADTMTLQVSPTCQATLGVPFRWLHRGRINVCHQRLGPAPHFGHFGGRPFPSRTADFGLFIQTVSKLQSACTTVPAYNLCKAAAHYDGNTIIWTFVILVVAVALLLGHAYTFWSKLDQNLHHWSRKCQSVLLCSILIQSGRSFYFCCLLPRNNSWHVVHTFKVNVAAHHIQNCADGVRLHPRQMSSTFRRHLHSSPLGSSACPTTIRWPWRTDHLTHTHCPFWTQKLPCFRPHSVEQSAWQFEERGHLTGTVQAIVENCLVWARIL